MSVLLRQPQGFEGLRLGLKASHGNAGLGWTGETVDVDRDLDIVRDVVAVSVNPDHVLQLLDTNRLRGDLLPVDIRGEPVVVDERLHLVEPAVDCTRGEDRVRRPLALDIGRPLAIHRDERGGELLETAEVEEVLTVHEGGPERHAPGEPPHSELEYPIAVVEIAMGIAGTGINFGPKSTTIKTDELDAEMSGNWSQGTHIGLHLG